MRLVRPTTPSTFFSAPSSSSPRRLSVPLSIPTTSQSPRTTRATSPPHRPPGKERSRIPSALLMIEHVTRVGFQDKTRRELGGNFFGDYARSVRIPDTWGDGDSWGVNYIGHPIHGAAAGFIWLDHEDGAHNPDLGFSREYWASRTRGTAWAAWYSVQFEIGPLSEASIGNVGLRRETVGWVDHVVTPVGALGFIVAEDALDRYLITRIESWTGNRFLRVLACTALNPSRTMSNAAQGRAPWYRTVRPLR